MRCSTISHPGSHQRRGKPTIMTMWFPDGEMIRGNVQGTESATRQTSKARRPPSGSRNTTPFSPISVQRWSSSDTRSERSLGGAAAGRGFRAVRHPRNIVIRRPARRGPAGGGRRTGSRMQGIATSFWSANRFPCRARMLGSLGGAMTAACELGKPGFPRKATPTPRRPTHPFRRSDR